MTEAYAIKGPYGIELDTVRESESICWIHWLMETDQRQDESEDKGYTCVHVTVSEKGEAEALLRTALEQLKGWQQFGTIAVGERNEVTDALVVSIDAYLSRGQG